MRRRTDGLVADEANNPGSTVAVPAADTPVAAAYPSMIERIFSNGHATVGVWLTLAATGAALGKGIFLAPNGGSYTTQTYAGAVCGFATGAGGSLGVTEV